MDGVELPQGYKATARRQFTDGRLSRPWSHPVVLNSGPQDWESSALYWFRPISFAFSCSILLCLVWHCGESSLFFSLSQYQKNIYLLKVHKRNTRKRYETCSKLTTQQKKLQNDFNDVILLTLLLILNAIFL